MGEFELFDFKKAIEQFFMVDELLVIRLKTEFHTLQESMDSQWLEVCRKVRRYKDSSPKKKKRSTRRR